MANYHEQCDCGAYTDHAPCPRCTEKLIEGLRADLAACQTAREQDARAHVAVLRESQRIIERLLLEKEELTWERDDAVKRLEIIHPVAEMLAREKDELEGLLARWYDAGCGNRCDVCREDGLECDLAADTRKVMGVE
jgi:hypothetical protein